MPVSVAAARAARLAAVATLSRLSIRAADLARGSAPRPDTEPGSPLRPGAGSSGGIAARDPASARAFPAYAGLGGALRGDDARHRLGRLGPCPGPLDPPGVGEAGEISVSIMGQGV